MAAAADRLTIADFERQYGDLKPHYEYWFGEAIQKAVPTWVHALLQKIIMILLDEAGYESGSEVKLKISAEFEPVPDVVATAGPSQLPYPTKPPDVVVEILSLSDVFQRVVEKCRFYADWGIRTVAVVDSEKREAWVWDSAVPGLTLTNKIMLPNGKNISVDRIFAELDTRRERLL